MDNQFKDKNHRSAYYDEPNGDESKELLDYIYGGFKEDVAKAEAEETEELKAVATSDFLKFYGFIRAQFVKLAKYYSKVSKIVSKKQFKYGLVTVAVLIIGINVVTRFSGNSQDDNDTLGASNTSQISGQILSSSTGETPINQQITESQGAIFDDSLDGANLKVIQQLYPEDISKDNNGLNSLALSIPEKTLINRFETSKGQIYVVNRENNRQTVIFKHQELLVFITSDMLVNDNSWIEYIEALN